MPWPIVGSSARYVVLSVVFFVAVAATFLFFWFHTPHESVGVVEVIPRAVSDTDYVRGARDAPIHLIVFTDFECPYCRRFHQLTLPALEREFGNQILVAYRHFPLASHPNAFIEAEAGECVSRLGGEKSFWNFADVMLAFPLSEGTGFDIGLLPSIVASIGIDKNAFAECMEKDEGLNGVREDILDAATAGIEITPSVVVRRDEKMVLIPGDYPQRIRTAIEYMARTSIE